MSAVYAKVKASRGDGGRDEEHAEFVSCDMNVCLWQQEMAQARTCSFLYVHVTAISVNCKCCKLVSFQNSGMQHPTLAKSLCQTGVCCKLRKIKMGVPVSKLFVAKTKHLWWHDLHQNLATWTKLVTMHASYRDN